MFPTIRCIIDRKLESFRDKLIETLEEEADLYKPKLTGKLLRKTGWEAADISFLIDAGMVMKPTVAPDQPIDSNLPH